MILFEILILYLFCNFLVQFVPFNNFKDDPKKLAQQVLEEIPRQIVEYYQHQNIPPGDPVVNLSMSNI